jgi:hypothetical protein
VLSILAIFIPLSYGINTQPYTVENSGNKYTVKGGELRKKLASTVMEMILSLFATR